MTKPEGETQLLIGKLVLEQSALEKQIGLMRDEIARRARVFAQVGKLLVFKPESLVFEGQTVSEQFADEPTIDRKAMEVDSLIAELRDAIVRKNECATQLAELGIDPEADELERNLRGSRAIWNPANVPDRPEAGGAKRTVGFNKPRKKTEV